MIKILVFLIFTASSIAAPMVPKSDQTIIYQIDPQQFELKQLMTNDFTEAMLQQQVKKLLSEAGQVGKSHYYQLAQNLLQPWIVSTENPEIMYQWAQVKQHQHDFKAALSQLDELFLRQPKHVSAHLMAARIHLLQRNTFEAQQHCKKILGETDVFTVHICLAEVSSYQGALKNSYQQLQQLIVRKEIPESHQLWLGLMLVDMAQRLEKYDEAIMWLNTFPNKNNLSYLTAWADLHFKLDHPQLVFDQLSETAASVTEVSDALILRLAMAERKRYPSEDNQWLGLFEQSIEVRKIRQDQLHANEMAMYYLYLKPNAEQALHWAKMNWQQSKEHHDQELLDAAEAMMSATRESYSG